MTVKRFFIDVSLVIILLIFFASLATAAISTRAYRSFELGSKEDIMNRRNTGLSLYDRNNHLFFAFERSRPSTFVPLSEIPPHVSQAIIVSEDKRFASHYGFSLPGIIRSAYLNWRDQELTYGGSTLTQQLAKNSFLTPDKSFKRKYNELILAIKLEQSFHKRDILEMYLNSAYFGEGVFGVEAAAQAYFDKSIQDITTAEASMLAAVLPEPANLSPLSGNNIDRSKKRQRLVLEKMMHEGFISTKEKVLAELEKIQFNLVPSDLNKHAPHFALMVRDELFEKYGEEYVIRSGLKVKTTLDLNQQQYAEKALKKHVNSLFSYRATNGSVVVVEPASGEVITLVGSADWYNETFGKINMAVSPRQSGSTFKPIVYASALQRKIITPSTVLSDRPRTFGKDYRPQNYDRRFRGNVLARAALANSVNIPAVDVMNRTGPGHVVETARSLGISTLRPEASQYLSTALGSEPISLLELTGAYATFANYGKKAPLKTILNIKDKYEDPVEYVTDDPHQAISSGVAFQISSMLSDEQARSATFGSTLNLPFNAAVKTGTTQDYRDAWTVGYTPNLSIGVWVGNSNNEPMGTLPGSRGSGPLWRSLMTHFHAKKTVAHFKPPSDVLAVKVCRHNGLPLKDTRQSGYTEYFVSGTKPRGHCVIPTPTPKPELKEEETPDEENKEESVEPDQVAGVQDKEEESNKPSKNPVAPENIQTEVTTPENTT